MDIFISSQNAELIIELLGYSKEYKEIKEEAESKGIDFNSIGSVIAKFLVRFQLFYLQTEKYCLKGAMKKIKACLTNDVQKMVSELKKEYPEVCDDSKIEEILLKFQFITQDAESRCLLAIRDMTVGTEATELDYKKATIEHIEAQSPTLGFTSKKPVEAVYLLGNMVFLEEKDENNHNQNVGGFTFNGNQKNRGRYTKKGTHSRKVNSYGQKK